MTAARLVELLIRALTIENEVAEVRRGHTMHTDRHAVIVVDRDGLSWRVWVAQEPWAAPA